MEGRREGKGGVVREKKEGVKGGRTKEEEMKERTKDQRV